MESKHFLCIINQYPLTDGHALVVPKRHIKSYCDLDDDELSELSFVVKQGTLKLLEYFATKDFNIALQEGAYAGQTVDHLHFHLLPRRAGDPLSGGEWFKHLQRFSEEATKGLRPEISRTKLEHLLEGLRSPE